MNLFIASILNGMGILITPCTIALKMDGVTGKIETLGGDRISPLW